MGWEVKFPIKETKYEMRHIFLKRLVFQFLFEKKSHPNSFSNHFLLKRCVFPPYFLNETKTYPNGFSKSSIVFPRDSSNSARRHCDTVWPCSAACLYLKLLSHGKHQFNINGLARITSWTHIDTVSFLFLKCIYWKYSNSTWFNTYESDTLQPHLYFSTPTPLEFKPSQVSSFC